MTQSPQFIPIKKGKEWSTVSSWRESPSLKPRDAPSGVGKTPPLSPQPTAPLPPPASSAQKEAASKDTPQQTSRRRGKSQGPEENFEDFMIKTALGDMARAAAESVLVAAGIRPLRVIVISAARNIPVAGKNGDGSGHNAAANDEPASAAAAAVDVFASPAPNGQSPGDDDGALPEMALPPSIPTNALDTQELHYFFVNSLDDAEKGVKALLAAHTGIAAETVTRRRALLNSTLVIKNLPFNLKCDKLVEVIESLPYAPSYVRLHRGERGLFKCIVFVKYPNRVAAECSKFELDRLTIGSRPMRVEFKKRARPTGSESAAATAGKEAERMTSFANLEKAVKDLRQSNDNEGFLYPKAAVTKDDIRYLKQLCTSFDLIFESSTENVTVRRKAQVALKSGTPAGVIAGIPGGGGGSGSASGSVDASRTSPAMHPQTPPWTPATPGSLQPLEFRGIRHWKEMRQKAGSLGPVSGDPSGLQIHRPLGAGDAPAFSAGRGRPIAART